MEKPVTNSSPKLGHFGTFLNVVRTGKAKQANGFSFLTSLLTRWMAGVRNGPTFSISMGLTTSSPPSF